MQQHRGFKEDLRVAIAKKLNEEMNNIGLSKHKKDPASEQDKFSTVVHVSTMKALHVDSYFYILSNTCGSKAILMMLSAETNSINSERLNNNFCLC